MICFITHIFILLLLNLVYFVLENGNFVLENGNFVLENGNFVLENNISLAVGTMCITIYLKDWFQRIIGNIIFWDQTY